MVILSKAVRDDAVPCRCGIPLDSPNCSGEETEWAWWLENLCCCRQGLNHWLSERICYNPHPIYIYICVHVLHGWQSNRLQTLSNLSCHFMHVQLKHVPYHRRFAIKEKNHGSGAVIHSTLWVVVSSTGRTGTNPTVRGQDPSPSEGLTSCR